MCTIPLVHTVSKAAELPIGQLLPTQYRPAASGRYCEKENSRESGEDKSGAVSLWKNQRIHMPFGTCRLNQFPAHLGDYI